MKTIDHSDWVSVIDARSCWGGLHVHLLIANCILHVGVFQHALFKYLTLDISSILWLPSQICVPCPLSLVPYFPCPLSLFSFCLSTILVLGST